jgi:hypothetical protein
MKLSCLKTRGQQQDRSTRKGMNEMNKRRGSISAVHVFGGFIRWFPLTLIRKRRNASFRQVLQDLEIGLITAQ